MDYDVVKVDTTVLALLHLTSFKEGPSIRAWRGQDWDVLNRLHQQGWIHDPKSKAKSVVMTDEGAQRSQRLFMEMFGTSQSGVDE